MKMDIQRPLAEDAGDDAMLEGIVSAFSAFERERCSLTPVLQFIQREHAHLSEKAIQIVAQQSIRTGAPVVVRHVSDPARLKPSFRRSSL